MFGSSCTVQSILLWSLRCVRCVLCVLSAMPKGRPGYKRVHHIAGKKGASGAGYGAGARAHGMGSGLFGAFPRFAPRESSETLNAIMEGSKSSLPNRYPRERERQLGQMLESVVDLQLHIPNSSFLGYFGQLQDQLRDVALLRQPLISSSSFLEKPTGSDPPTSFLWKRTNELLGPEPTETSEPVATCVHGTGRRKTLQISSPQHPIHQIREPQCQLAIELAPASTWMEPGAVFFQNRAMSTKSSAANAHDPGALKCAEDLKLQLAIPRCTDRWS